MTTVLPHYLHDYLRARSSEQAISQAGYIRMLLARDRRDHSEAA